MQKAKLAPIFILFAGLASSSYAQLVKVRGYVQNYPWGGKDFIPSFLGTENPEGKPHAEVWYGTHPKGMSLAVTSTEELALGSVVQLPFLMKVLDARQMLSIQVHPHKDEAEAGYRREEALKIGLDAPTRNYKDANHKPEAHIALSDFWLLHGFRPLEQIAKMLGDTTSPLHVPEFASLFPNFATKLFFARGADEQKLLLEILYTRIMYMDQARVDTILADLIKRLEKSEPLSKESPDFWALKAAKEFKPKVGQYDRGIFSIYLMNLVHLKPGEGTVQNAGVPHAYLEGQTVEIMADSDNVLRGGLTPKHIDIDELISIMDFSSGKPRKKLVAAKQQQPYTDKGVILPIRHSAFSLGRVVLKPSFTFTADHSHLVLPILQAGQTFKAFSKEDGEVELRSGEALYVSGGTTVTLHGPDVVTFIGAGPRP